MKTFVVRFVQQREGCKDGWMMANGRLLPGYKSAIGLAGWPPTRRGGYYSDRFAMIGGGEEGEGGGGGC
uniref:Uncharacterized protein n=1 Tax=Caenorhabditis japonica TaxID=281687 RepID=A0A8R1IJ80_CAEJA